MRVSRAEELARRIEQQIVDNGMNAGERLGTKREIRARFGYAVATVNEALRLLETRGMIDARPGRGGGMFVAAPSSRVRLNRLVLGFEVDDAPFTDCLVVRDALDPLVCHEAATHCTEDDAEALRAIVARMREGAGDPAELPRRGRELYRRMVMIATNAPLKTVYLSLLDFVDDEAAGVGPLCDHEENLALHEELVEAVIDGDRERLAAAIRRRRAGRSRPAVAAATPRS